MSPILYVFARTDMDSMNPGRVAAQVSHATSLFHQYGELRRVAKNDFDYNDGLDIEKEDSDFLDAYLTWLDEADGFGTIIVLEAPYCPESPANPFEDIEDEMDEPWVLGWGPCVDPEYALFDGRLGLSFSVTTTVWAFVDLDKADLQRPFAEYNLYGKNYVYVPDR